MNEILPSVDAGDADVAHDDVANDDAAVVNDYDSYTYEESNIELPDTVKTFMGDAAEKLGLDTSKEDWLSSLLNGPSQAEPEVDQVSEPETDQIPEETGSENELT